MSSLGHTLRLFDHRVEELSRCRIVRQEALRAGFTMRGGQGRPLELLVSNPDEDDLRSFLLTFRVFMMKGEPTYLPTVFNAAYRVLTSDALRDALTEARAAWKAVLRGCGIEFRHNAQAVPAELILDLWINGHYFHNDRRKADELMRILPLGLSRFSFLNALVDAAHLVFHVGHIIRVALREELIDDRAAAVGRAAS